MDKVYFDYASTTPVDPAVTEAMMPYFSDKFGNAASPHAFGREAEKAVEDARERVARFINADKSEIIFNSGATEGINHAILGTARAAKDKGRHMVVTSIEHSSVLSPVEFLKNHEGYQVTYIDVDPDGLVNPGDVDKAVQDDTILVAVMHANNEIGTVQNIPEIGRITKDRGVPFLVDAVQTVGHIPVDVEELQADFIPLSAHKCYGPKGVGALYVRRKTELPPFLMGGSQEGGQRASTQNVAGIAGLAKAIELCEKNLSDEIKTQTRFRDFLLREVPKRIEGAKVNGHPVSRLPGNVHFAFEKVEGEALLMSLDMAGIAASMGSACASGALKASHVLKAIGLSDELAFGALRLSIGRWTTQDHIDALFEKLPQVVEQLRF